MYQLWYTPELAPYMATELLNIAPLSVELLSQFVTVLKILLESGINEAVRSHQGERLLASLQTILDNSNLSPKDTIFVRLGTTSTKDSFAVNVPTTKPDPLVPNAEVILRRLLTSGRSVGRLLSLSEGVWEADPGEAIIIQRWSPAIELAREIRVFCYKGRITAISQDVWWEKMGWRERYTDGLVPAIESVWENVKGHLPFDTCVMDVFVTQPVATPDEWKAQIIEFNGFGAHLNTGSDLFHWVNDRDILYGEHPGITVRFVDDWEDILGEQQSTNTEAGERDGSENETSSNNGPPQNGHDLVEEEKSEQPAEPDWLVLEKKLRQKYADSAKDKGRLEMEKRTDLPLRGRWCSAY